MKRPPGTGHVAHPLDAGLAGLCPAITLLVSYHRRGPDSIAHPKQGKRAERRLERPLDERKP
jgi:hypothetical protein